MSDIRLDQLDAEICLALGLAERLGLTYSEGQVTVLWGNQDIVPTPTQEKIALDTIAVHVPDPDWLDPLNPDYDWQVWKQKTLDTPPPYRLPDLWGIVMRMLGRM